eukprot:1908705-Rhodomonas_salina.1
MKERLCIDDGIHGGVDLILASCGVYNSTDTWLGSILAEFGVYNTNLTSLSEHVYASFGFSASMSDIYFIDSGCSRTIVCNDRYMKNLRSIALIQ